MSDIVEAVTDELLAHGEFSSGANNRSNAREAARVVIDIIRTHDEAARAREDLTAKAAVAYLIDHIEYSDSYGVQGSDFQACHLCSGGGAPGISLVHDENCPVRKCEAIAAEWVEELNADRADDLAQPKLEPRLTDNDDGEISVTIGGKEVRGWSYKDDAERRAKMFAAREYVEGWHDGRQA